MYNDYFGLKESPFSIAPNPQFLYLSERHREALAHLLYGIKSDGGFILLTGEVGTGKTTMCRCLLEQIPLAVDVAFVLNPKLSAVELLATVCDDLGISYPEGASIKVLTDRLNSFLLDAHQQGRRTVLIIDEAQNLDIPVLEQLRLLTNLETNERKLLQIILLGQPELLQILAQPELRQLLQRVTARFHLEALSKDEIAPYVEHRLAVAGARGTFYDVSEGIPRLINLICDRALLGAYAENRLQIDRRIVDRAAAEVLGRPAARAPGVMPALAAMLMLTLLAGLGYIVYVTGSATPSIQESEPQQVQVLPQVRDPDPEPTFVPVAAAQVPAVDTLAEVVGDRSIDGSMAVVFELWGVALPTTGEAYCDAAQKVGFACLRSIGSVRDLRHINLPAVLSLSVDGVDQYVVVTGIEGDIVTVSSSTRSFRLPEGDIVERWDGNYVVLWPTPPGERTVQRGESGPSVDWLYRQLGRVDGLDQTIAAGAKFDQALERRVKHFQIGAGLRPDGVAGALTWILLGAASKTDAPRLSGVDD
jgi:general secretion pathway protein A